MNPPPFLDDAARRIGLCRPAAVQRRQTAIVNEAQFRSLCEACDQVLLAPDSTIERVSIPWLHVIREHPEVLAQYTDVFDSGAASGLLPTWRRRLRSSAVWVRQLGRALRSTGDPWHPSTRLPERVDFLIVSHFIGESPTGGSSDFYFGNLPDQLVTQGHSVVIALINHTKASSAGLARSWVDANVPRVVLSRSLNLHGEAALRRRLTRESAVLRRRARESGPGLLKKVLLGASDHATTGGAQAALRLGAQVRQLADRLRPNTLMITHEGHSWERMAFAAARRARPGIRCMGYQHAGLFRLQHAVRRSLGNGYDPDEVLTTGTVYKVHMERSLALKGVSVSVLGSNRGVLDPARESSHTNRVSGDTPSGRACLVLPEGFTSECHLLFEFSLACARALPELQFIWRLHPLIHFDTLAANSPALRRLPPNVQVSDRTLEEDAARSAHALYRGTTAIIKAVLAGARPIYLDVNGELGIDPLFELGSWRKKVTTVADLRRIIRTDSTANDEQLKTMDSALRSAQEHCSALFMPFAPSALFRDEGGRHDC